MAIENNENELDEVIRSIKENENLVNEIDSQLLEAVMRKEKEEGDRGLLPLVISAIRKPSNFTINFCTDILRNKNFKNRNTIVIYETINALVGWDARETLNDIVLCAAHRDQLVRQSVVEAIWDLEAREFRSVVKDMTRDRSPLVRHWAINVYADLFENECAEYLLDLLSQERDVRVKTSIFWGLRRAGRKEYLEAFINQLNSRSVSARFSVLNSIEDLLIVLDHEEITYVVEKLQARLKKEKLRSVQQEIQEAVKFLQTRLTTPLPGIQEEAGGNPEGTR